MLEWPCPVTIDAGVFVSVARPDIVVGLPERRPGRQCVLQVCSVRTIPVVKEALVEWVPDAGKADSGAAAPEDMGVRRRYNGRVHPGLDIQRAYHATVDVGRQVLRLGQD
jgi:hypothetical protein